MRIAFFSLICLLLASCSQKPEQTANYQVVPLPQQITVDEAAAPFKLSKSTVIAYPAGDEAQLRNAELLAEYIATMTGNTLAITDKAPSKNAIVLESNLPSDNAEAYNITVNDKLITVNGASAAGTFYGIQTLRKAIPDAADQNVLYPAAVISDQPRFGYRGVHLDISRHFFPADSIKNYIDMAALHNINRVHLHLTDDQGWRIEIKKRPLLTEVGSVREGTMVGHDFNTSDSIPVTGYLTQDEARDIVKYAADRHITIIPEIDLPGHMIAALKAYPELGCTGGPYEIWQRWGVSEDLLCAGNDSVYAFLDDVLDEIVDVFPSEYIHIGGDECPKVRWEKCPKCQAKIKELGLKSDKDSKAEAKLQSHVMAHATAQLAKHGRKAIGWDEILEGGLAPGAVIMSWRGVEGGKAAANAGHDAIMTPVQYCYFDYLQAEDGDEIPLPYHTFLPIEKVYSFDPVSPDMTPEVAKHILGAQANVWTEYIPTYSYALYKTLPRLAAMSEVQWVQPEQKNYDDFKARLHQLVKAYDAEGYNYAKFVFEEETPADVEEAVE